MTFNDHELNRVIGPLCVFTIALAEGEEYRPVTDEICGANGVRTKMADYEFKKGDYYYKILKVVYEPQAQQWLAITFEMPPAEDIL